MWGVLRNQFWSIDSIGIFLGTSSEELGMISLNYQFFTEINLRSIGFPFKFQRNLSDKKGFN